MIFAIPTAATAMPVKPKMAAIMATTKKTMAQISILKLLLSFWTENEAIVPPFSFKSE
jgi:hypothetical protein